MTTKHAPATPLPWHRNDNPLQDLAAMGMVPVKGYLRKYDCDAAIFAMQSSLAPAEQLQNSAYIVAACNAYPRLVGALRGMIEAEWGPGKTDQPQVIAAAALLSELGEI